MNIQKELKIIIFFILIFLNNFSEVKIVLKVNNEIITNIDLKNESKYLKIMNSNFQKLTNKEITELSKKSLVRQIIKKNELKKYFDIEKSSNLGEKLIKKNLIELGFKNKSELLMFLESENLNYEIFKEKLIFENLWNSLVFEKFKNKVKIDENKFRARIIKLINNQEKIYEYNLSEILVDFDTNYIELQNYIEKFSFENAASKYSLSDTASNGGKIGWINPSILTKNLKEKISKLKIGEITDPIKVPNGNLLLKLNSKKEIKNKINVDDEVNKQINFERNRQLNSFSLNYYKKLKQNSIINEY